MLGGTSESFAASPDVCSLRWRIRHVQQPPRSGSCYRVWPGGGVDEVSREDGGGVAAGGMQALGVVNDCGDGEGLSAGADVAAVHVLLLLKHWDV